MTNVSQNRKLEHAMVRKGELPLSALVSRGGVAPAERLVAALVGHIKRTGLYPPLIVRPVAGRAGRWEVIDGRARATALARLGRSRARCEVWSVDEQSARLLAISLNGLRGRRDARRTGRMLARLARRLGTTELAGMLAMTPRGLKQQLAAATPPPVPPMQVQQPMQPVTFHLAPNQHQRLQQLLSGIRRPDGPQGKSMSRGEALLALLEGGRK